MKHPLPDILSKITQLQDKYFDNTAVKHIAETLTGQATMAFVVLKNTKELEHWIFSGENALDAVIPSAVNENIEQEIRDIQNYIVIRAC